MHQGTVQALDKALLLQVVSAAVEAGNAVKAIYESSDTIQFETKSNNTPVTLADHAANDILNQRLPGLLEGVPLLSEESVIPDFSERSGWCRYWLVDPLDGTKAFIRGEGEFTVNIALIERGIPVLGVVYAPAVGDGTAYAGLRENGAFKYTGLSGQLLSDQCAIETLEDFEQSIQARKLLSGQPIVVACSRSRAGEEVEQVFKHLSESGIEAKKLPVSSALKLCFVAEGGADLCLYLAPTCEWDSAAGQAVVEAAGGLVLDDEMRELRYNAKADLHNPYFFGIADREADWPALLF
jgi:3'(2'), 5'-bisphosphate nucleotidase